MLARIYIEALLADEDLTDRVWELWNLIVIDDELASIAWRLIATSSAGCPYRRD